MTKKYECSRCGIKYLRLKDNFSKDTRAKSGYKSECKQCKSIQTQQWLSNQTPEKLDEIKLANVSRNAKYRLSQAFKDNLSKLNARRRELRLYQKNSATAGRMMKELLKYLPPERDDKIKELDLPISPGNEWVGSKEQQDSITNFKY